MPKVEKVTGLAINDGNYLCDCPFCGKKVYKFDEGGETVGVIHVMPMCEKFQNLPVHDYISEVFHEVMKRQPN